MQTAINIGGNRRQRLIQLVSQAGGKQEYLDIAGELRANLEQADGFISIERFESLTNEGKMLSLSY